MVGQLHHGVNNYVERYNHKRLHQSLNYATPAEVYLDGVSAPEVSIKWKYQKELKSVEVICEELNLVITKKEEVLNAEVEWNGNFKYFEKLLVIVIDTASFSSLILKTMK